MIFDLGGGSTEFIFGGNEATEVKSIPLGAMTLTQRFLNSDPPEENNLKALERFVDEALLAVSPKKKFSGDDCLVVGTGGTVTTLAAMIHGLDVKDISPDRMNGLNLERERLEELFSGMRTMTIRERMKRPGLDRGRADVILAGSMVVIRILHSFKCLQMVVCLSDLLEGILIANLEAKA
jgi:exopolyphosphatase/guanosine-5'-triphosphate,3'-diphosphate pyrophosphatase